MKIARLPVRRDTIVVLLALVMTIPAAQSQAQLDVKPDSTVSKLEPVVVTVTRGSGRSVLRSPFAITLLEPDSARPGGRHTAIDEALALVPGLSATSRNNPSQDPRLSIRGFGARSAFGVRGVRVMRDGIPITLPDGQTPLDYLSLESVGRIEVLRGAASALYGNASGGVIDIQTAVPSAAALSVDATQWRGSEGFLRSVLAASGTSGSANYVGDVAYSRSDGYRAHSSQRAVTGFARSTWHAGSGSYSLSVLGLHNPLAENPGALTIDEMRTDAGMADALSVRRNARKAVEQVQVGLSGNRTLGRGEIDVSIHGGARSLDNPLTFAVVEIGRHSFGASSLFRTHAGILGMQHRLASGIDLQSQNDLRRNFSNCVDTIPLLVPTASCPSVDEDRGIVTLDQRELVSSAGAYVSDEIDLSQRLILTAGIRADNVRFEVRDRLTSGSNTDDSGSRSLGAVSPVLGLLARVSPTHSAYANLSSAFETPTATELGNRADGSAGINPDLAPQRSVTGEIGVKGWFGTRVRYDLSVFDTRVRDELVPFEIPASNGRRYFRNAGRTRRTGGEAGGDILVGPVSLMAAYSYSHFRFEDYRVGETDFSGNTIPGLPRHRLQSALRMTRQSSFLVVEAETAGGTYADDANTVRTSGFFVWNLRAGSRLRGRSSRIAFLAGVQNALDRLYSSSIAVNAARGKYYEPAPRRSFSFGLSLGGQTR